MNKILVLGSGILTLAVAGLILIPSTTQAQSSNGNITNNNGGRYGYQQSMASKAEVLGMTSDQLRDQLESKTLLEIANEKGVSEEQLHTAIQTAAQKRWEANGLTQSEIDSRLKDMADRQSNCDGTGNGGGRQHNRANL